MITSNVMVIPHLQPIEVNKMRPNIQNTHFCETGGVDFGFGDDCCSIHGEHGQDMGGGLS